ncbi:MAG: response regulator [Merdibacter sp.]
MRILIAEDERDLNNLITQRLIQEHYSVDSCYDGEEALDFLRMADYDALILDIMMPRLDGLSVLRTLRENKNDVAVLLLTAKDSIEDRVKGLDAGADDYLIKPFAFEELSPAAGAVTHSAAETE